MLYDTLMAIGPSPVVALNRAIAVGQHSGPERGLEEIHSIVGRDRLAAYPFYFAALGEFELRNGKPKLAREQFQKAMTLARNPMERVFIEQRIDACTAR
jgi:predicted RNA polymerase sigma factor